METREGWVRCSVDNWVSWSWRCKQFCWHRNIRLVDLNLDRVDAVLYVRLTQLMARPLLTSHSHYTK